MARCNRGCNQPITILDLIVDITLMAHYFIHVSESLKSQLVCVIIDGLFVYYYSMQIVKNDTSQPENTMVTATKLTRLKQTLTTGLQQAQDSGNNKARVNRNEVLEKSHQTPNTYIRT